MRLVDGHAARRRIVRDAVPSGAVVAGREDGGAEIRIVEEHAAIRDTKMPAVLSNPKLLPEETLFSTARLTVAAAERKPEPPHRLASTFRNTKVVLLTASIPWLVMASMATFQMHPPPRPKCSGPARTGRHGLAPNSFPPGPLHRLVRPRASIF